MNTYLLTWNPARWAWNVSDEIALLARSGFVDVRWSCGRTRRIERGDRVFLLRQGREPRGIMASGTTRGRAYEDRHWDARRRGTTMFVDVRFDALLNPDEGGVLALARLRSGALREVHWRTQSSGIAMEPAAAAKLERLWAAHLEAHSLQPMTNADEVANDAQYREGATSIVTVNRFERDPRARKACIAHHGAMCSVCGFDFGAVYGEHGRGFMHVHHLVPLATIGKTYAVDPVKDLRPVCPNCHAMLHRGNRVLKIATLRRMLRR
ncbi:MAG: HNH endonuclease [bacterium]